MDPHPSSQAAGPGDPPRGGGARDPWGDAGPEREPDARHDAAGPRAAGPSALARKLREARASYAFSLAAVLLLLLAAHRAAVPFLDPMPHGVLVDLGAYDYARVRDHGEWWRFFTTLFVSRMAIDALIYAWIFLGLGPAIERSLGTVRFTVLYLAAGAGGVALGELLAPNLRGPQYAQMFAADTLVAVYAVLGGAIGLVVGKTGKLSAAVTDPGARGAAFWLAIWVIARYSFTKVLDPTSLGAAGLGAVIGAALALGRRRPVPGIVALALALALVAGAIALAAQGRVLRDGELVDRGRPAGGGPRGPGLAPGLDGGDAGAGPGDGAPRIGDARAASSAAREALEPVEPFLAPFGPLPDLEGIKARDRERAFELARELDQVALGPNLVVGELDPARIRLHVLASQPHPAARVAEDLVVLAEPGLAQAQARALAGLAARCLGGGALERAEDHLEAATRSQELCRAWPEAVYHYACVLADRHGDDAAFGQFQQFLRLAGEGVQPPWRLPMLEHARRATGR